MKMAPKAKKEAPAPPKAEAKASRRGLIPRVSLVCKPEIPVAPRDEH